MKNIIVAPVSKNIDALFVGIKEFPTEKVVLLAPAKYSDEAKKAKRDLERFRIPAHVIALEGDMWEETFRAIAEIKNTSDKEILVNVSTGDELTQCAATSAAFVNGLKAFGVVNDEVMLLPVLKFNYYKLIPEKKMLVLNLLHNEKDCCASFDELGKRLGMSLPLVSYHINGNAKSEGLKQMGLVDVTERKGRLHISLTSLGRLLIKGYVA